MIDSILEIESVLIKAIQKLDIEMFKEFYLNVEDYKHSRKLYFLRDLELAFSKFRKLGDTVIVPNLGSCGGCNKGCYGYQFVGNNSKNYFDLVFEKEADKIMHIALPIGPNVLMGNDVPESMGRTNENENRSKISINCESLSCSFKEIPKRSKVFNNSGSTSSNDFNSFF